MATVNSDNQSRKRRKVSHKPERTKASSLSSDSEDNLSATYTPPSIKDEECENGIEDLHLPTTKKPTEVESALPAVNLDKEAIKEYETLRPLDDDTKTPLELQERLGARSWTKGRSSIYVDAFNLALETVLDEEGHLFNAAEMHIFEEWRRLSYEGQYLYVRLFLRKTSAWHRISKLGYHSDIADMDAAVQELQKLRSFPSSCGVKEEKHELSLGKAVEAGTVWTDHFTFADASEEHIKDLEEASSLLSLDELKAIAKEAKVQGKNKSELLKALRNMSQRQSGLGWVGLKRANTAPERAETDDENAAVALKKSPSMRRQATDSFLKREYSAGKQTDRSPSNSDSERAGFEDSNRDQHFVQKALEMVGPCIRLTLDTLKLFERVHLVYYRSTEWTEKSLTTIILARIQRRNFPEYIISRSANIFASREVLLEFEAALRLQYRMDSLLEMGPLTDEKMDEAMQIFESVYPRWKVLLQEEQLKEDRVYESGEGAYLRRFSPGWVYTRIVHKIITVLGRLKQHKREHQILTELLEQKLFHPSRRGSWYQRKALLEEHYMAELDDTFGGLHAFGQEQLRKKWKRTALETSERGLQDSQTHVMYHYDLQKRIRKLEKALKIAKRLQHDFGHVSLAAPSERQMEGIQIRKKLASKPVEERRGAPTIWIDPSDGVAECSVEAMCLSQYRAEGWKGYHAEGGIIRTLFAYLFYDVLFVYIPNVFQTPYQTCPLDLHTDAFFPSRASEIYRRLAQISNGEAASLIKAVDEAHRENATCVVGLRWDFALEDLLEIADCFDGAALATVCMVMAQEYQQRGGGIPDLFLWNTETKQVMFSEVKSANDRLSDTQRLWIHVLTGAGVKVELCNAVAKDVRYKE